MEKDKVDKIIKRWKRDPEYAVEILHDVQKEWKYLPEDVLRYLADELRIPQGRIYHIATFHDFFTLEPSTDGKSRLKPIKASKQKFLKYKEPTVLRNFGHIKPDDIESYKARGGYKAFEKVVKSMPPTEIISVLKQSELSGRGGIGEPTYCKWEMADKCSQAKGTKPIIIANGYGGGPGAFSDAFLMEMDPHQIIEGMLIGAYTVKASEGYIFIGHEFTDAIKLMKKAINDAKKQLLIGKKILGTDFSFDLKIRIGGGAYISGEASALVNSLVGKAPEPKDLYVPLTEKGMRDKPTLLSNVETWANIPVIIDKGAQWFSFNGTKLITICGDVVNKGVAEIPLGVSFDVIINEIAGGMRKGKKLHAIQVGGITGGFLHPDHLSTHFDYRSLGEKGLIIGNGVINVLGHKTCVLQTVIDSVRFLRDESCGKCTPCREGLQIAYQILSKIPAGEANPEDLITLRSLFETMRVASLCGLGKHAATPFLTAIKYFGNEFDSHVKNGKCPACKCDFSKENGK